MGQVLGLSVGLGLVGIRHQCQKRAVNLRQVWQTCAAECRWEGRGQLGRRAAEVLGIIVGPSTCGVVELVVGRSQDHDYPAPS